MRKFKIGESVLIRTDLAVGQVYRTNNGAPQAYFAEQMTIYKGKKLLIVGKDYTGQKQIPKLAKVDVVSQYIEGREMPKLVPVAIRCPECDSIVSIRDNYCSDCGQALNFDFKEGH